MGTHYSLTDKEFENQFSKLTLDPALFTHEAHLRLAWIHINKYGLKRAIENICDQIKRYDLTHGDGTKFHFTLSVACVQIIHHFVLKSSSKCFEDFILEFPRLTHSFKELIDSHYSPSILSAKESKKTYITPDIMAFEQ